MKKRVNWPNILTLVVFVSIIYFVHKYQDTESFQGTMKFLFNPDAGLALPLYWQDNRMLLMGFLIAGLLFFYRQIWFSYKSIITIHRESPLRSGKPSLSPLDASYHYQQDRTRCAVTWFIDLCCNGSLTLHDKKGVRPWSVSRGKNQKMSLSDQQLVDILFQEDDIVPLQASFSDPNPHVEEAVLQLYKTIESENSHFFKKKRSSLIAWLVLIALVAEIPFFMASQNTSNSPGIVVFAIFSAGFFVMPAYAISHEIFALINGPKIIAYCKVIAASLFALFGNWIIFSSSPAADFYLNTALYPNLVVPLIVFIYMTPLVPTNNFLLPQIIGYKKYLSGDRYHIMENDLPWTLGLDVHSDIIDHTFHYGEETMPEWLITDGKNVQSLIQTLHQTLYQHVNEAINGKKESKSRLGGSSHRT